MYDDKPGEVVNATIAGHGVFQILFFKVLLRHIPPAWETRII